MTQALFLLVCIVIGLVLWYRFVVCDGVNTDF